MRAAKTTDAVVIFGCGAGIFWGSGLGNAHEAVLWFCVLTLFVRGMNDFWAWRYGTRPRASQ